MSGGIQLASPGGKTRQQLLAEGLGHYAETYPRGSSAGANLLADGRADGVLIGLKAGDLVSKIWIAITGAGVAVTASKVALVTTAGARLAISADQGTAWQGTGLKPSDMLTPYTVPADGVYYAAVFAKATTTLPTLGRGSNSAQIIGPAGASPAVAMQMTGQTDIPSTVTWAAGTFAWWLGIS